jgi:hypothetical protein
MTVIAGYSVVISIQNAVACWLKCSEDVTVLKMVCCMAQYTHESNFIYAYKESVAFPALIFMELTTAEWCFAQICCNKFYPNVT